MTIDIASFQSSFSKLKKTARSDEDVLTWFKENPQSLPFVPPPFWPYLVVKFRTSPEFYQHEEEDPLVRQLVLAYTADIELPVSMVTFDLITGIRSDRDTNRKPIIEQHLKLELNLAEWPYAAALLVYDALNAWETIGNDVRSQAMQLWARMKPDLSWQKLLNLHSAGLVPDDDAQFLTWALDNATPADNLSLPSSLAP